MSRLPHEVDVFVAGGGPAGLAAALAARRRGLDVLVTDRERPGVDKACGEGLMPDGVVALRHLGIELVAEDGARFRGIRFVEHAIAAEAVFPDDYGFGIRRTRLHRILVERAEAAGVRTCWGPSVESIEAEGVRVGGRTLRCRWIIGADGYHSRVRQWAGLHPAWSGPRRIGLRQHFTCRPWSDLVEVHWANRCQAYVTPVGPDAICVALLGRASGPRFADLPTLFPVLARRLADAEPVGDVRGAASQSTRLRAVTSGRIALVGDASGSVDAVTGEGLALAFRQASALGDALAAGDLARYEADHRRIVRMPHIMARALLLLDGSDSLRQRALRALAARPASFDHLLGLHVGGRRPSGLSRDLVGLAWRLVMTPQ
jgi:flavin-dependent dehydrogenase